MMENTTSLIKTETQNLVTDGRREKLVKKLNEFRVEGLTAKEKEELDWHRNTFVKSFTEVSWEFLGISKTQLVQLGKEDLEELAEILNEKTKMYPGIWATLLLPIPIVGWIALCIMKYDDPGCCLYYRRKYKILKKALGENYFPHEALKRTLT